MRIAGRRILVAGLAHRHPPESLSTDLRRRGGDVETASPSPSSRQGHPLHALVFDARGVIAMDELRRLKSDCQGLVERVGHNGRIVFLGLSESRWPGDEAAAVQASLTGFVRSLARETGRRGTTVQIVRAGEQDGARLCAAIAFFLSPASAYITAQSIEIDDAAPHGEGSFIERAELQDRTAIVTGAARGIGSAVAARLSAAGARVVGVDLGGRESAATDCRHWMALDLARKEAAEALAEKVRELGGCDIVVHSAGILRDRSFARMSTQDWRESIEVNLAAPVRINRKLLAAGLILPGGSVICLSSISGIAGNFGQTNYAAAKAGLIGHVRALGASTEYPALRANAVAPGLIETGLTRSMPWLVRAIARRMNALGQAGQPDDVAALAQFLAAPAGAGINGRVIRVCGGSLMGA